jgi:hypothetical protein
MKRIGYAQVEPNHLSARYTGQIYAQLPAKNSGTAIAQLENGQFLKYNYKDGCASVNGDGEWMLVFNEEKLYDERRQNHKDFVMLASDMTDGLIYPRLLKTNIGDIFITNAFGGASAGPDAVKTNITDLALGDFVTVGNDGWLAKTTGKLEDLTAPVFQVVPHFSQFKDDGTITPAHSTVGGEEVYAYTLPDMQDAVKLQRVK